MTYNIELLVLCTALGVACGGLLSTISDRFIPSHVLSQGYTDIYKMKKECEENLPRSISCVPVVTFIEAKDEKAH